MSTQKPMARATRTNTLRPCAAERGNRNAFHRARKPRPNARRHHPVLLGTTFGAVVWGIRLEGKVSRNRSEFKSEIDALKQSNTDHQKWATEGRNQNSRTLKEIHDKLDDMIKAFATICGELRGAGVLPK